MPYLGIDGAWHLLPSDRHGEHRGERGPHHKGRRWLFPRNDEGALCSRCPVSPSGTVTPRSLSGSGALGHPAPGGRHGDSPRPEPKPAAPAARGTLSRQDLSSGSSGQGLPPRPPSRLQLLPRRRSSFPLSRNPFRLAAIVSS